MAESGDHHDALFKWSFGQLDRAAGELRAILPAPLAAAIDWSSIDVVSGSFVDENLGRRHSDLVYSASWQRGGELLVYVLFEHQSSAEPLMGFRLLRYMVRIWDRWLANHPSARHLPPIIPVVLSHGPPWSAARQFRDLLAVPDLDRPFETLGSYLASLLRANGWGARTGCAHRAAHHGGCATGPVPAQAREVV